MPDLACIWCGKIECTSEYRFKRHLAVCSKRFSAYVNEPVNESDRQIPNNNNSLIIEFNFYPARV